VAKASDDYKNIYLLPGFDGTGLLFGPVAEAFGYRCRTTVLPFKHEITLEDYVQSVSDRLPKHRVILLAESFSVPIALSLLARFPGRFDAAILCSGFASSPFGSLIGLSRWITESFLGNNPLQNLLLNKFCDIRDIPQNVKDAILSVEKLVPPEVVKTRFNMIAGMNVSSLLSRISAPVLYLRALKDKLVSTKLREELFESVPQICMKEIDAPHLLLQLEPKVCADSIMNFLELS
jgi:pimeloyl-ACP methyl ester carboxylesterase